MDAAAQSAITHAPANTTFRLPIGNASVTLPVQIAPTNDVNVASCVQHDAHVEIGAEGNRGGPTEHDREGDREREKTPPIVAGAVAITPGNRGVVTGLAEP